MMRGRKPTTIYQQFLCALLGVNMLALLVSSVVFYSEQEKSLLSGFDAKLTSVATLVREILPSDYHDRITGPDSVSDADFLKIVDRNNRLCQELGLEYIWSLMVVDGRMVFTTSTSPDKVAANRKHAQFFEEHSNPELYAEVFATMRKTYKSNHDKWGDIRVVLIPAADSHGRKYLFGASVRLTEVSRQLREIVWQSVAVGLAVFVFSIAVGFWACRKVTFPLHRLTETIRDIALGKSGVVADESGSYEQVTLARHFNRLNDMLQEKISELKESHAHLIDQRDVERKRAEEDLVVSEQRYHGLLNFAVDGILIGTSEGIITEANECMCQLFGRKRHEIVDRHIREMPFTPESIARSPLRFDLLQRGETVVSERTIRRADGSEVVIEMHTKMMPDGTYQSIYHDISKRKYIENTLEETRKLLDEAQSLAKLGAWKYEVATERIVWTDEVYRIHGVGREFDTNNLTMALGFYVPEHRLVLQQALQRAVERAESFDLELEFVRANGEHIWVRSCGRPTAVSGQVISVSGSFMDISERKLAEAEIKLGQEKLARQYEVLAALLKNLKVGVFMVEAPSGKPLVANQAASEMLGRGVFPDSDAGCLGEVYKALRASDGMPYPIDQMPIQLAMSGISARVEDLVVKRPDGTEVLLEVFGTPVRDEGGRVWASLVSFIDITERKRIEQELRNSEERYRMLFEMESDAIFLIDNQTGQVVDVNLAAQSLYGYSRSELLALRNTDISAEPEQTQQATEKASTVGGATLRIAQRRHRKRDGSVFPVEIAARCFSIHGRSVHIAAMRDISERVKTQELLESWNALLERRVLERTEEVNKYARQLQALTGRLVRAEEDERQRISDVLHEDLQQTLVAARMTLGGALASIPDGLAQETLSHVDTMLTRSLRLTRSLVQEIAVPAVREGDLPFAIGWIAQQMQEKFGLEITLTCGEDLPPVGQNVYICLYRVIQELLFNVVKHSGVRQATVEVVKQAGDSIRISVSDCGCGFSLTALEASDKGGDGFGLFSIRERIEGLCGRLEIGSAIGQGTTVILTVPLGDLA